MYKLVVFDFDGTIADTLCDLAVAVNTALSENNLPTHPEHMYNQFVGNGADRLIATAMGDSAQDKQLFSKVKQRFSQYYAEHSNDCTKAYDGINELLSKLSDLGISTAVLSNKPHIFIKPIADKLFREHEFCYLWGNQDRFPKKPDPTALRHMMAELGISERDTLYVGDSDVDIYTAHNAGVRACGVEWGFRTREELINAGADYLAPDVDVLFDIITKEE